MNNISDTTKSKFEFLLSMVIFGTIGIFVKNTAFSSAAIAFFRGVTGVVFLLIISAAKKRRISLAALKKNLPKLVVSGICIGINWICLFEAYRYTTVATATLCYYFAPVFVIIVSPFLLKQKLHVKNILCILFSLVGMFFVSGVGKTGIGFVSESKGIILGLTAAAFYAGVMLCNIKLQDIASLDRTVIQLLCAAITVLPYELLTDDISAITFDTHSVICLLCIGVIHTGAAYYLYFGSFRKLNAVTVAVMSYIDPIVAIILSALLLKEKLTFSVIIGALLILGSSFVNEIPFEKLFGRKRIREK